MAQTDARRVSKTANPTTPGQQDARRIDADLDAQEGDQLGFGQEAYPGSLVGGQGQAGEGQGSYPVRNAGNPGNLASQGGYGQNDTLEGTVGSPLADSETHHHYRRWRDAHLNRLDDDYSAWMDERKAHFSEEFEAWRRERKPS
ncbi:hypothetical protein [Chitinolyticbacter meiyuanensis]|uniref:hypothetical protein n=1 Tax=Chitinolyticbacter meiyuanensis TaxID=682798 RepID=UPI0011E5D152|nr:hypothetical protein [Chitinolyticbacter meiyuanensis]